MTILAVIVFTLIIRFAFFAAVIGNAVLFYQSDFKWAKYVSYKDIYLCWTLTFATFFIGFILPKYIDMLYALNSRVQAAINRFAERFFDNLFPAYTRGKISFFVKSVFDVIDYLSYRVAFLAFGWMSLIMTFYFIEKNPTHSLIIAWQKWIAWGDSSKFISYRLLPFMVYVNFGLYPTFLLVNKMYCTVSEKLLMCAQRIFKLR